MSDHPWVRSYASMPENGPAPIMQHGERPDITRRAELFRERLALPLDEKIRLTEWRVIEWWERWKGKVYVSFSGGKDSTVLLHLVRTLFPDVPGVFCDTGLEYPEIRKFAKDTPNVEVVRPRKMFHAIIREYGYPVISKEQASYLHEVRTARARGTQGWVNQRLYGIRPDGTRTKYCVAKKWRHLADAPFMVSDKCCTWLKKEPMRRYAKQSGCAPILGMMASESILRKNQYLRHGCNAFHLREPMSRPMAFWTDDDVWAYIRREGLAYSPIYDLGYDRTGCMFCCFGVHLEETPNRFQRMAVSHPAQWRYCTERLGIGNVLDYLGVPWGKVAEEEL